MASGPSSIQEGVAMGGKSFLMVRALLLTYFIVLSVNPKYCFIMIYHADVYKLLHNTTALLIVFLVVSCTSLESRNRTIWELFDKS